MSSVLPFDSVNPPIKAVCGPLEDDILAAKVSELCAEVVRLNMSGLKVNFSVVNSDVLVCFPDSYPFLLRVNSVSRFHAYSVIDQWINKACQLREGSSLGSTGA